MRFISPLVLVIVGATLACDRPAPPRLATAGDQPSGMHPIGPQPGPDRPWPEPVNPYSGNTTILPDGQRLFNWMNCAGCHGDHGGGGMGPSLRDSTWIYGGEESDIFFSIAEGRANGMPAWGTKLPADQIWRIVSYIKSMRTANEPSPPH